MRFCSGSERNAQSQRNRSPDTFMYVCYSASIACCNIAWYPCDSVLLCRDVAHQRRGSGLQTCMYLCSVMNASHACMLCKVRTVLAASSSFAFVVEASEAHESGLSPSILSLAGLCGKPCRRLRWRVLMS